VFNGIDNEWWHFRAAAEAVVRWAFVQVEWWSDAKPARTTAGRRSICPKD